MSLDVEFNIIRIRLDSQMCFMSLGKNDLKYTAFQQYCNITAILLECCKVWSYYSKSQKIFAFEMR